jgi:hypothetical protein
VTFSIAALPKINLSRAGLFIGTSRPALQFVIILNGGCRLYPEVQQIMTDPNDITQLVRKVQEAAVESLKQFLFPRSASIAREVSEDAGELWGTGSYLQDQGRTFLLTNRHVAEESKIRTLSHVVRNDELMAALNDPYVAAEEVDIALMPIRPEIWLKTDKVALLLEAFDAERPAWDELLMVVGFPYATSRFSALANAVRSKARPYIAQPEPALGDDGIHFWMKHRPAELRDEKGNAADWIDPRGMSGSLVWNTGIVKSVRDGVQWSPDLIKPAGMLDASDHEKQALQVIRLDVVRSVVQTMLCLD